MSATRLRRTLVAAGEQSQSGPQVSGGSIPQVCSPGPHDHGGHPQLAASEERQGTLSAVQSIS